MFMIEFLSAGVFGLLLIAICTIGAYEILRFIWNKLPDLTWRPQMCILAVVSGMFAAHIANIWLFGVVYRIMIYLNLGRFADTSAGQVSNAMDLVECLYISSMIYTTVGTGEFAPEGALRMIVGVEAITGFMLIGWTISFAYLAMEKFWRLPHRKNIP